MPRIRMIQSAAGHDFSWAAGEVVDVTAEQAAAWADGERAELVRDVRPERAVQAPAPERATKRPAKKAAAKPETA